MFLQMEEFTITDIENPNIAPKSKNTEKVPEILPEKEKMPEPLSYFLKDELSSDLDDDDLTQRDSRSGKCSILLALLF